MSWVLLKSEGISLYMKKELSSLWDKREKNEQMKFSF